MSARYLYISIILLWGLTWLAIKHSVGVVAPEVSVFYRFAIASILLIALAKVKKQRLTFGLHEHLKLVLLGSLIFSCNFAFFYHAAKYLTSGLVAILFATSVMMIMLNNVLFFGHKPTGRMFFGAILGCLGLCCIFYPELKSFDLTHSSLTGVLLGLCGSYCFSWGNVVSSHCSKQGMPLISMSGVGMIYGSLIMLGYCLLTGIPIQYDWTLSYTLSLAYLAIPGSVVGFLIYLSLIQKIGPQRSAYATLFFPIVALIVSTLVESFHWVMEDTIGILLVLIGNALILIKPKAMRPKANFAAEHS